MIDLAVIQFHEIILCSILCILAIILIVSFIYSIYNNRDKIKFYSILTREDGKISKLSVAFLFTLPIILYQAITTSTVTQGLLEMMYAIFAADLGVKGIQKWQGHIIKKERNKKIEQDETLFDDDMFDKPNRGK